MKIKIVSLLVLFTLFVSGIANAQYRGGLDRSIGSQDRYNQPTKKSEPVDFVKVTTDKMTKDLELDGFQSAVVKNIIEDYMQTYTAIVQEEIPNQGKQEKIKVATDKMESKIIEVLNPKQKDKFQEMKDKLEKKDKKKKKDKKEEKIIEKVEE